MRTLFPACLVMCLAGVLACDNDGALERPDPPAQDGGALDAPGPAPGRMRVAQPAGPVPLRAERTLVDLENAQPGSDAWELGDPAAPEDLAMYAQLDSVTAGSAVPLAVHSAVVASARFQLFRLGFYDGAGGRLLDEGSVDVSPQTGVIEDPGTGLVEATWATTFAVTIPPEALSGVYLIKLVRDDGAETTAPIVVRPRPAETHEVLLQIAFARHQAYNEWGEVSLYVDRRFGRPEGMAQLVSFDRPYLAHAGMSELMEMELNTVRWLEGAGYDVGYLTSLDLDREPIPPSTRLFISAGHDEYASSRQRDHLEQALAGGVSLAFLTADAYFWQVRYEDAPDGRPGRRMRCVKDYEERDPLYESAPEQVTTQFASELVNRPEARLLGLRYNEWHSIGYPWIVRNADHWVYEGTGVRDGDAIPGVLGVESDGLGAPELRPPGLVPLARSPVLGGEHHGGLSWHEAASYDHPAGGFVVSAGTIQWGDALGHWDRAHAVAQRMMANVLRRAGALPSREPPTFGSEHPPASDFTGAAVQVTPIATGMAAPMGLALAPDGSLLVADAGAHVVWRLEPGTRERRLLAGQPGKAGLRDGRGEGARFHTPIGLAVDARGGQAGYVYVTDGGNAALRRIELASGNVVTLVNRSGTQGVVDGPGATARFSLPLGVTVMPDGAILVADFGAGLLRRVAPRSPYEVTTWAEALACTGVVALADGRVATLASNGAPALLLVRPEDRQAEVLAGGDEGGFSDGVATEAKLWPYLGLAHDGGDELFVGDTGNYRVRRVEMSTARTTTFAGSGRHGSRTGPGSDADLVLPTGLAWDAAARVLYVSTTADGSVRALSR